jgi:hypothetical protein
MRMFLAVSALALLLASFVVAQKPFADFNAARARDSKKSDGGQKDLVTHSPRWENMITGNVRFPRSTAIRTGGQTLDGFSVTSSLPVCTLTVCTRSAESNPRSWQSPRWAGPFRATPGQPSPFQAWTC